MNTIESTNLTPEEILWPPKIDLLGLGLVTFLSLVVGFIVGIVVFMLVYFSFWDFLFQTWASSILIAMFVFIAITLGNTLYTWWISSIFPYIYTATRTLYVQVSVYSVILYILMSIVYFTIGVLYPKTSALLAVYAFHIVLNTMGLFLLTGILSQYRYALLTFYSSIVSLIITGLVVFLIYISFSESARTIFLFMGLPPMTFLIATFSHFCIWWLYAELYASSGSDPLGDVLQKIQSDEKDLENQAEKYLFSKK